MLDGDQVTLPPGIKRGANHRFAGEDVRAGAVVLTAGSRLRAQEVGMAASLGRAEIEVRRPLRVAVFSTGDEVRDVDQTLDPGCIYDINRYTIMALLEGLGCRVSDLGIFADRLPDIQRALRAAATDHDLLMTSGGVSKGDEDHVKNAIAANGCDQYLGIGDQAGPADRARPFGWPREAANPVCRPTR